MSGWRKRQIMEAMSMVTKEEYVDLVNESNPVVKIGRFEYGAGTILRAVDPVQFDIEYNDYLQYLDEVMEDRVN